MTRATFVSGRRGIAAASLIAVATSCVGQRRETQAPWVPPKIVMVSPDGGVVRDDALEARIDDVATHMAIEDQLALVGGTGFETRTLKHLDIQSLRMTDGPLGVRQGQATAMPAGIALGASWDPALAERVGKALGEETLAKGRDVLLGPTINIMRTPQGGRTFEAYSEDPWLTSRLAVGWIRGVQSTGVAASVKHFAANNQEFERDHIDVRVSERALREIYLPAFEAAVTEGGAFTVMAAYNKVNGQHCAENSFLIDQVLKGEWHFQGLVMSDWGAVHSSNDTANHGVDLEMPTGRFMNRDKLEAEIYAGRVQRAAILDKVRRILRVLAWTGRIFTDAPRPPGALDTPAHRALAREAATAGIVLLKNERNLLPIDPARVHRIAVIGASADRLAATGGGSAQVSPPYVSEPLGALRQRLGNAVRVDYALGAPRGESSVTIGADELQGLRADYFDNPRLEGAARLSRAETSIDGDWGVGAPAPGIGADDFSVRWHARLRPKQTRTDELLATADDGVRVRIDGKVVIDDWSDHAPHTTRGSVRLEAGRSYDIVVEYYEHQGGARIKLGWAKPDRVQVDDAVRVARGADLTIVFAGTDADVEGEGHDRDALTLPGSQESLILAIAAANPNTVVVLNHGQPLSMEAWVDRVPALVDLWFPGQEGGNAITDVLLGTLSPSGKLPVTFPKRWEDAPSHDTYPGKDGQTQYSEGVFVGYRHYDHRGIEPRFPFGFGLSYTRFDYSALEVKAAGARRFTGHVTVKNAGARRGAEVVEVYVHPPSTGLERPDRELRAFAKVDLSPGASKTISFDLDERAFATFDEQRHAFTVAPGRYEVLVGASSRDVRLRQEIDVQ